MSLTVYEKHKSPRAKFVNATENNGSSIEFTYVVLGTNSEITAANAALAIAPLAYLVNDEVLVRQASRFAGLTGHVALALELLDQLVDAGRRHPKSIPELRHGRRILATGDEVPQFLQRFPLGVSNLRH